MLFVRFPDRPEAGITLATAAEAFLLLSFLLLNSALNTKTQRWTVFRKQVSPRQSVAKKTQSANKSHQKTVVQRQHSVIWSYFCQSPESLKCICAIRKKLPWQRNRMKCIRQKLYCSCGSLCPVQTPCALQIISYWLSFIMLFFLRLLDFCCYWCFWGAGDFWTLVLTFKIFVLF